MKHRLLRQLVPVGLLVILFVVAMLDPPLDWLSGFGSWLMVAAALGLVWALWHRRKGS